MRRRRTQIGGELTSLIDVLFILVFAALVSTANAVQRKEIAVTAPPPVVHRPSPSFEALRRHAVGALAASLDRRPAVHVRVSRVGIVDAVEYVDPVLGEQVVTLAAPLVERVADPDVGLAYLGDRNPDLRVCSIARRATGRADLDGSLVVLVPEVGIGELPFALVRGLERDVARCFVDEQAVAVLVDPMWPEPVRAGAVDGGVR